MTIRDIAEIVDGEILGADIDLAPPIDRVAKIEEADVGSITFLSNPKYEKYLASTKATAILVSKKLDLQKIEGRALVFFIRVDDPYVAFLNILKRLTPAVEPFTPGVHPSVSLASSAQLGKNVSIGAGSVIEDEAVIGENTKIGPGCVIGKKVQIGNDCLVYANVVLYHQTIIGHRCVLHSGVVIGSDGFGFVPQKDGAYEKIPQLGIAILEDDVEVGANSTIDRATMGETRVCRGVKLDNLVQIAHNVVVGDHTVIAAQSGIAGSSKIGKNCMIGGQVGIAGHITIADRTVIMAQSGIPNNITEPGKTYFGYPADEARKAQRAVIAVKMLPDMIREVTALQKKVEALEHRIENQKTKEK
jgi:UDP-3-O-[3-hydroxymyristoyl] glucosamine N-acyltransferase